MFRLPLSIALFVVAQSSTAINLVQDVALGNGHVCAILTDNSLKCWGNNSSGQLGYGDTRSRGNASADMGDNLLRVNLGNGRKVKAVALGNGHTCALLDNGKLKCWGSNAQNQLGYGDTADRGGTAATSGASLNTVDLGAGRTALQVSTGLYHTCVLLDNKSVKCWGYNGLGQLGLGRIDSTYGRTVNEIGDKLPAVNLGAGKVPVKITAGGYTTCVQFEDKTTKCFGINTDGRLGIGEATNSRGTAATEMGDRLPSIMVGQSRQIDQIFPGYFGTCAKLSDGMFTCWGSNLNGEMCSGNTLPRGALSDDMGDNLRPIQAANALQINDLSCSTGHCCALFSNNGAKCWGNGNNGRLGTINSSNQCDDPARSNDGLPFVNLGYLLKPTRIFSGSTGSCVLFSNGRLKCWGSNNSGQTGIGSSDAVVPSTTQMMGDDLPFINL